MVLTAPDIRMQKAAPTMISGVKRSPAVSRGRTGTGRFIVTCYTCHLLLAEFGDHRCRAGAGAAAHARRDEHLRSICRDMRSCTYPLRHPAHPSPVLVYLNCSVGGPLCQLPLLCVSTLYYD